MATTDRAITIDRMERILALCIDIVEAVAVLAARNCRPEDLNELHTIFAAVACIKALAIEERNHELRLSPVPTRRDRLD